MRRTLALSPSAFTTPVAAPSARATGAWGARLAALVLGLYGLALTVEIARSYILIG